MKRFCLLILFALSFSVALAQKVNSETEAVKGVINQLFDGMRKGDSTLVSGTFSNGMIMQSISDRQGTVQVRSDDATGFLKAVGTPHPEVWDERITFDHVLIDGNLASVWTRYKFYVGEKFSHCGVNSFQLVKKTDGWKIVYLIDTRRKEACN